MSELPIVGKTLGIRPSRNSKRRAAALIAVHLLIVLHITHWLVTGSSMTPLEPSEAMAFTKAGIINAGAIFFAVTILSTLVLGRLFCGWACHLVALQDLCRWLLLKAGIRPRPLESRLLRWVPFLAFAYMFLWPIVFRYRSGGSFTSVHLELTTEQFWATFPGWIVGIATFLICGFVIVYLLGSKGFCTYACPYGAAFILADRFAPRRIRVTDACEGCAHCTATCSSNVRVHEQVRDFGMVVDDGCLKTLDCVSVCPNEALYYGRGISRKQALAKASKPWRRRSPLSWGEELILAFGFIAAFLTFRGLYGLVPFLLSLGLSAVLAYLVLTTFRLATRPNLSLRQFRLKVQGHLQPAGRLYLAAMVLLVAVWGHSAVVQYHQTRGEHYFEQTAPLRHEVFDVTRATASLDSAQADRVRRALHHLEQADRFGLTPAVGNASRRAWLYFLAGSPVEMSLAIERAIELGEYASDLHHLLALEALRGQDSEQARTQFELAIAADPSRPEPYLDYGLFEVDSGDLEAAAHVFERAVTASTPNSEIFYNAGLARALLGDAEGATKRFTEAVELDPAHLPARENLAGILASQGRFVDSERHYRLAIQQDPEDAETRYLLAVVLAARADIDNALDQLERALQLKPDFERAIILRDELEARRQP